jgi:hypothetical protein
VNALAGDQISPDRCANADAWVRDALSELQLTFTDRCKRNANHPNSRLQAVPIKLQPESAALLASLLIARPTCWLRLDQCGRSRSFRAPADRLAGLESAARSHPFSQTLSFGKFAAARRCHLFGIMLALSHVSAGRPVLMLFFGAGPENSIKHI